MISINDKVPKVFFFAFASNNLSALFCIRSVAYFGLNKICKTVEQKDKVAVEIQKVRANLNH